MAPTQRLEIKQGQSLVMTPQLQQAIKLLQLSNLELAEYVEGEMERNPLLEREDAAAGEGEPAPAEAAPETGGEDQGLDQTLAREDFGTTSELDAGRDDLYADEAPAERREEAPLTAQGPATPLTDWTKAGTGRSLDGEDGLEGSLAAEEGLQEHLEAQLTIAKLSPARRFIAAMLIDSVDEAGYLRADLKEVAERLGVETEECEATLAVLQGFDPPGVFARDLSECLAIQLKELNHFDPAMQAMLTRLDLVAKRDMAELSKLCGVDNGDIADMISEIRKLNPKPGLKFGSEPVQPVVPDVFVREASDGSWHVELNTDTMPRVLVNSRYYTEVNRTARSREDKTYLSDCLNTANWLVKSLDQRARTILKVASEIVRQQDAFLTRGVRHLRPLNLRLIADAIAMHESTVSRVTSNKYMATPRGVFELKYFFTAAIASAHGGEAHSAESVRDRIKELIGNERHDILSDDRIVAILNGDGIDIARRTVAKYRESLRIPSSVERRRMRETEVSAGA